MKVNNYLRQRAMEKSHFINEKNLISFSKNKIKENKEHLSLHTMIILNLAKKSDIFYINLEALEEIRKGVAKICGILKKMMKNLEPFSRRQEFGS